MNGTEQSSRIHMKGLRRMVELRGGLTSFYHNKVLQRVLTWYVFVYLKFDHSAKYQVGLMFYILQPGTANLDSLSFPISMTLGIP